MRRIAILGSTGSIGRNTLEIIRQFPDEFKVIGLSANSNIQLLHQQIRRFSPQVVAVRDDSKAKDLSKRLNNRVKILAGEEGIQSLAEDKGIDILVLAISGSFALLPLLKAVRSGKTIALANKEALVMAGSIVIKEAASYGAKIIPIDSEQSAIWQCMEGKQKNILKKIYLTASGGPFKDTARFELKNISPREVLRHPRWKMGKKVTVDSATLMNKGLELIESMWLFNVDVSEIEVVIHPEAIIHSMVEFIDGSILAQLSITDMRIPIQYALTYPERKLTNLASVDFFKLKNLSFFKPNLDKFPCLRIAYQAARKGGSFPCVLNAANEMVVEAFLRRRIAFSSIHKIIERVMHKHKGIGNLDLNKILKIHAWARLEAEKLTN